MTSERFHKAAKDNILEILKETTRKDCNTRDQSGMTPTLWAAFEGHIEALRLLVARGGDPDKADYFGNTALHLSSARGHELCVRFLVKFGCNIWSLDIDRHSARELAAINGCERILQFLDVAQTDQELNNRKKSRMMKEKAEKEAEKRLKEYVKRQKVAESRAEKEQKKMLKDRARLESDTNSILTQRPCLSTLKGRLKPSPTYSDIVGTTTKRQNSAVGRKALARKAGDDFKVVEIELDGKKSVRSLTGLRRDSEIMYVGTYDGNTLLDSGVKSGLHSHNQPPMVLCRGKISDVWGTLNKARSTPDLLVNRCFEEEEENDNDENKNSKNENKMKSSSVINQQQHRKSLLQLQQPSIFNRPNFCSVAFRQSMGATLDQLPVTEVEIHRQPSGDHLHANTNGSSNDSSTICTGYPDHHKNGFGNTIGNVHNEEMSIGSAGSLARRQSMWDDDLLSDDEMDEEWTPLQRFLVANNLSSIHSSLEAEQIDLEALMLLTESDIAVLKLPLGPRRKLMHAIASRKKALENQETIIEDIKL